MPGDKFPYKSAFGHSIRDLWTRQAYEYLRRLCLTLEMDPTIADGKIKRGDENKPWGIPIPASSGITGVVFNAGKMWISQTGSFDFTASTDRSLVSIPEQTGSNDMAYIRCPFDGTAPQWKDTTDFIDADPDAEWFFVSTTIGDIHVDRA